MSRLTAHTHSLLRIQLPITEYNTEVERALLLPKECAECPLGFDRQLADFGIAAPNECREARYRRWSEASVELPLNMCAVAWMCCPWKYNHEATDIGLPRKRRWCWMRTKACTSAPITAVFPPGAVDAILRRGCSWRR